MKNPPVWHAIAFALLIHSSAPAYSAPKPEAEEEALPAGFTIDSVPDWVKPVTGWVPVKPGEHPRLFFRKSDLPELKKRAETPEGKAILARLRATLGGGESMPTKFNASTIPYDPKSTELPEGGYTISHAAGFGFLYQLTGDKKYADLARQCVEVALKGQRDRDDRYSLAGPHRGDMQLRMGPTLGWYALAYDLCYDGWPEDFRTDFAKKLITLNAEDKDGCDLRSMVEHPQHMPSGNHWGARVGGVSLTLLAINGDPGVDQAFVDKSLEKVQRDLRGTFIAGFGDAGWFSESSGPSQVSSTGITPALQAFKIAAGKDYTNRPNVRWMTMRWAYDLFSRNGRASYACRMIGGNASYGTEDLLTKKHNGGGMSHGGYFSQGFGVVADDDKAALLWTWENVAKPAVGDNYDAVNYPHRAILAFLNWPIGMTPKNPSEVLPRVRFDSVHGYASFRNQWKDDNDLVVSAWAKTGPNGWIGKKGGQPGADHNDVFLYAYGKRLKMGTIAGGTPKVVWSNPDGSGQFTNGNKWFAVDYSRRSGSDALIVNGYVSKESTNPTAWDIGGKGAASGGQTLRIVSVNKNGIHPKTKRHPTDKNLIIVGNETISYADGVVTFAPLQGAEAGTETIDANPIAAATLEKKKAANQLPEAEVVLPTETPLVHLTCDTIGQGGQGGTDQTLTDSSPNKLPVEIVGAPAVPANGVNGKAIQLNGTKAFIRLPANPKLDLAGKSLSLSIWFRNETSEPGTEVVLFEKNRWAKDQTPDCYSLVLDPASKLLFNLPSINGKNPSGLVEWADAKWHHAVATWDTETKKATLYYDGNQVGQSPTKPTGAIGEGSSPLTIGARGGAKASNFLGGLIDDVRIYDRPLTRGEVRALYKQNEVAAQAANEPER